MNDLADSQIFGDGENLVVVMNERDGKNSMALECKKAIVKSMSVDEANEIRDDIFGLHGIEFPIQRSPSIVTLNLELVLTSDNIKWYSSDKGNLKFDLDLFRKFSISEMFGIINKKLNQRCKKK